jgi:hypothetical protein
MSTNRAKFHVEHTARPAHIEHIVSIASEDSPLDPKSTHSRLTQEGYPITYDGARRSLDMGAKLGLFEKSSQATYILTARGQACRNLALYRREVYCDVMHFLLFATWELNGHQDYWSWSYARTCEILWRDRPIIKGRKTIFGQLSAEAAGKFSDLDPVVGTETIYAVTNWLRELSPPFLVFENDKLISSQEREWFSVELALLAVSYLYTARGVTVQTPLLLDRDALEQLCPLCLAPTDRIVAMIETASRTFPALDIHTSEWGSSAILRQPVDVSMLT